MPGFIRKIVDIGKETGHGLVALFYAAPVHPVVAILVLLATIWCVGMWPYGLAWLPAPLAGAIAMALLIGPLVLCLHLCIGIARMVLEPFGVPNDCARGAGGALLVAVLLFGAPASMFAIHTTPLVATSSGDPRPDIGQALDQWVERCHPKAAANQPIPVVILALAGGASLSATWSLSVLDHLEQKTNGALSRHVFALSSVSGGSLGAVTYARIKRGDACAINRESLTKTKDQLAHADLLGLTVSSMFLVDVLQAVPGVGHIMRAVGVGHRGDALERSFEGFWRTATADAPARPEVGVVGLRAAAAGKWVPHLLLNGTDVASGKRVVTSTVRMTAPDAQPPYFLDADDLIQVLGRDMPQPVGVTNSARFSYVSPVGQFMATRPDAGYARQIADGGYFENFGATTGLELANAITRLRPNRFMPILLVISAEAALPRAKLAGDARACGTPFISNDARSRELEKQGAGSAAVQVLAPPAALYNTRGAHGAHALQSARLALCANPTDAGSVHRLIHIPLRKPEKDEAAPLNWLVGEDARRLLLTTGLQDSPFIDTQITYLRAALRVQ